MDKVNDSIKKSCANLLNKNIIDRTQYNNCLNIVKTQKWRQQLEEVPNTQPYIQELNNEYERFKKIIDTTFAQIETAQDKKPYIEQIGQTEKDIKTRLNDLQSQKESRSLFREFNAKLKLNHELKKDEKKIENNIKFLESKKKNLELQNKTSNHQFYSYLVLALVGLFMILIISFSILYGKYYKTN
jgi:hypothetical protein